jgi:hypothetical protein
VGLIIGYSIFNAKFNPILPNDEFAFGPTPQKGQTGGIEGVYYHRASSLMEVLEEIECKTKDYGYCITEDMLRLYSDGDVVDATTGSDTGTRDDQLPNIQKWLNRDTGAEFSHGKYYILGKYIWFSTTAYYSEDDRSVTVDYSGIILGDRLILDVYSHYNGKKIYKMIFYKLHFDN